MELQQDDTFQVAPTISDHKLDDLKTKILITLLGLPYPSSVLHLILYFLIPCIIIIPPIFIPASLYWVGVLVPGALVMLLVLVMSFAFEEQKFISRYIIIFIYGFLWCNYFAMANRDILLIVLGAITVTLSISTICLKPVLQFSGSTPYYSDPGFNSTLYIRFLIAFPTLLALLVINLTKKTDFIYLHQLQLCTGLLFVTWMIGWISSIRNNILFFINSINHIIFADEKHSELLPSFCSLIFNISIIVGYLGLVNNDKAAYFIGTATLTSFVTLLILVVPKDTLSLHSSKTRIIASVVVEVLICGGMIGLSLGVNFATIDSVVFLAIDLGMYAIFLILKELRRSRSKFGCLFGCQTQKQWIMQIVQRFILRTTSCLAFISLFSSLVSIDFSNYLTWQITSINSLWIPLLAYRSFKHCLSSPRDFSLHLALLLSLILKYIPNNQIPSIVVAFIMPPFPHNFLRVLSTPFFIPEKLIHRNQCCRRVLYILFTTITMVIFIGTLGIFDLTMAFGLPIFFCVIPTHSLGTDNKTKEQSLYEKIVTQLPPQTFRGRKIGFYLLRMGKYIMLVEIASQGYGCLEIIDFKGMQVQQVTTCHAKEGQTIDKLAEQTWGSNKQCCSLYPHITAIWPQYKQTVLVSGENQIQLTGIIESEDFFNFFKETLIKAIAYYISKITVEKSEGETMVSELSVLMSKERAQSIYPFEFSKEIGLKVQYPHVSTGRKKLPPINPKAPQKEKVIDDFMELLGDESSQKVQVKPKMQKQTQEQVSQTIIISEQQITMATILTIYYYVIGKINYLNQEKLYKILKKDQEVLSQISFEGKDKLIASAVGSALKITINKVLEAEDTATLEDFKYYEEYQHLGTIDTEEFAQALRQNRSEIWSINYAKRSLAVKRLSKVETDMYVFGVDAILLKSIWNNLRSELIFATNDDDERYSIQTHPYLLRNLFVEACQQPYGYPGFHSGLVQNQ